MAGIGAGRECPIAGQSAGTPPARARVSGLRAGSDRPLLENLRPNVRRRISRSKVQPVFRSRRFERVKRSSRWHAGPECWRLRCFRATRRGPWFALASPAPNAAVEGAAHEVWGHIWGHMKNRTAQEPRIHAGWRESCDSHPRQIDVQRHPGRPRSPREINALGLFCFRQRPREVVCCQGRAGQGRAVGWQQGRQLRQRAGRDDQWPLQGLRCPQVS